MWVWLVVIAVLAAAALIYQLRDFKRRGFFVSSLKRAVRWEFWPMWLFYTPVMVYIIGLAFRYRNLTICTAANPGLPAGGLIGESKSIQLSSLMAKDRATVAHFCLIDASLSVAERLALAQGFMETEQYDFPIILKPNDGQRGQDVAIIRSAKQMEDYLTTAKQDIIIQEYVPGLEFGVFYVRLPQQENGFIFSITAKRFPELVGDGQSTLAQLILNDPRALYMARYLFDLHKQRLDNVPAAGERFKLVEIGSHCRGSLFLDGQALKTPELEARVDAISKSVDGFYFGRYDIRVPSLEDFQAGRNLKIIELNGLTAEATHIYDPNNSVFDAYATLFEQWRLAFEVGSQNAAKGAEVLPIRGVISKAMQLRQA